MRSSRIAAEISKNFGITNDTAKKRISRVKPPVYKFPIQLLPKGETFLYLEKDRNSDRFWEGMIRDLREAGSIYGIAIDGLLSRGGVVQISSFGVISGSPEVQKNQIPFLRVLENLIEASLVKKSEIGELGECISLNQNIFPVMSIPEFRAQIVAENLILDAFREWVRNLGFASFNLVEIRNLLGAPKFSTFQWDLCGPSYLLPFINGKNDQKKPGFFVADVCCNKTIDRNHIQYFLRKIRILRSMRGIVQFLPVLLADGYTKEALLAGKSEGAIIATISNLFGDAIADALKTLISTLTHAAAIAATDPDRVSSLLNSLKGIEGAAGNLRGALFEMIVGYLVLDVEGNSIDIGEVIRDPKTGELAEIDVRRIKERKECWSYECRGRQPNNRITLLEAQEWVKRIQRILNFHRSQDRFRDYKFGFELWTTGEFDSEAIKFLEEEKQRRSSIELHWRNKDSVREYAKRASRKSILDTLDQHYFKHLLNDRSNSGPSGI